MEQQKSKILNVKMSASAVLLVLVLFTPDYIISKNIDYANISDKIKTGNPNDRHGGIKMGISSNDCDNGQDMIEVDWNNSQEDYTCYGERIPSDPEDKITKIIDIHDEDPIHVCLPTPIHYKVAIPTSGYHRPLWPSYGEYTYLPPQRWVHSLEHGAAVFLYHPCVEERQLEYFKNIAFNCLKKIIITPYRNVSKEQPFVVVTYKAKLMMNNVQRDAIEKFIQENVWQRSEEKLVWADGKFNVGLIRSSYEGSKLWNNYTVICSKHFENNE